MNNRPRANATKAVTTAGQIFPDGAMIELVAGPAGSTKPHLLLWNGTTASVASQVQHRNSTYEAPDLSPSIYRATRLPGRSNKYKTVRQLFSGIAALFNHHLHFSDGESKLLAIFSMSTWLADRLAIAPSLVITGPDQGSGIDLLKLLSCLCRRPLILSEVTPAGFRSLPMHLSLTLLINQSGLKPNMQRLFRASNYRGLHVPGNRGSVVSLYGPKAIFCGTDAPDDAFGDGVIQISMAPSQSQWPALNEHAQEKIASDFQPRLLQYRLKNCADLRESRVDGEEFTSVTRRLACALAACLSEDSELARDTVRLLRPQDDAIRERRYRDINCVVVEILWGFLHQSKQKPVTVGELANAANALLRYRGEILTYSAEEIGWKLNTLGIPRHTSASGREILLGLDTRRIVHKLAYAYDLPLENLGTGCPNCATAEAALSTSLM